MLTQIYVTYKFEYEPGLNMKHPSTVRLKKSTHSFKVTRKQNPKRPNSTTSHTVSYRFPWCWQRDGETETRREKQRFSFFRYSTWGLSNFLVQLPKLQFAQGPFINIEDNLDRLCSAFFSFFAPLSYKTFFSVLLLLQGFLRPLFYLSVCLSFFWLAFVLNLFGFISKEI